MQNCRFCVDEIPPPSIYPFRRAWLEEEEEECEENDSEVTDARARSNGLRQRPGVSRDGNLTSHGALSNRSGRCIEALGQWSAFLTANLSGCCALSCPFVFFFHLFESWIITLLSLFGLPNTYYAPERLLNFQTFGVIFEGSLCVDAVRSRGNTRPARLQPRRLPWSKRTSHLFGSLIGFPFWVVVL